jgi:integrase
MHSQTNRPISGHVRLRTGKRGATWYAKYRGPVRLPDGQLAWKQTEAKIGPGWTGIGRPPAGSYTQKTAQAWLDAKLTDLRRGIGIPNIGDSATFADAAAEWYRSGCTIEAWKPSTRRDYRSALSAHLGVDLDPVTGAVVAARPPFGDLPLEEITTAMIRRWRTSEMTPYTDDKSVERVKLTRRMAVKTVAIMHGIFVRARTEPFNVTGNPAADVEPLRDAYDATRFDFYTVEEVMALVRAAEDEPDADKLAAAKQDGTIYLTAALTGLRLGEVLALRVRDVDFDADTIRVLQSVDPIEGVGTTKSGHGRSVPMVPQVAQALARLLERDRFTGDDGPRLRERGRPVARRLRAPPVL